MITLDVPLHRFCNNKKQHFQPLPWEQIHSYDNITVTMVLLGLPNGGRRLSAKLDHHPEPLRLLQDLILSTSLSGGGGREENE